VNLFRFIEAEKALYPISLLCRVLKVSRSGYYTLGCIGRHPGARWRTPLSPTRSARSTTGAAELTAILGSTPSCALWGSSAVEGG